MKSLRWIKYSCDFHRRFFWFMLYFITLFAVPISTMCIFFIYKSHGLSVITVQSAIYIIFTLFIALSSLLIMRKYVKSIIEESSSFGKENRCLKTELEMAVLQIKELKKINEDQSDEITRLNSDLSQRVEMNRWKASLGPICDFYSKIINHISSHNDAPYRMKCKKGMFKKTIEQYFDKDNQVLDSATDDAWKYWPERYKYNAGERERQEDINYFDSIFKQDKV